MRELCVKVVGLDFVNLGPIPTMTLAETPLNTFVDRVLAQGLRQSEVSIEVSKFLTKVVVNGLVASFTFFFFFSSLNLS